MYPHLQTSTVGKSKVSKKTQNSFSLGSRKYKASQLIVKLLAVSYHLLGCFTLSRATIFKAIEVRNGVRKACASFRSL